MLFNITDDAGNTRQVNGGTPDGYKALAEASKAGHRVAPAPAEAQAADQAKAIQAAADGAGSDADTRRRAQANREDWTTAVHPDDKASAEADAAALRALGLTPGRTWYAPGTPLVSWGLDKWQAQRDALTDAPPVAEVARKVAEHVKAEERRDVTVQVHDLRLDVRGSDLYLTRASRGGRGGLRVERNALQQLCSRAGLALPSWGFTQTMTGAECADLFNSRVSRYATDNDTAVVRFRNAPGGLDGHSAFAIVSERYTPHDADALCNDLAAVFGQAPGSIVYDPDRAAMTWDIKSMRDLPPVVGEVYAMFARGRSADDGSSSVWTGGGILRAICVNLTTEELATAKGRQVHRARYMGQKVRQQLRESAEGLRAAFPGFAQRTEVLAATDAAAVLAPKGETLRDAIAALVESRASLREAAAGIKRDALVQALLTNASAERDISAPGSLADVVNAVTRMHTQRVPVPVLRSIEAEAGRLSIDLAKRAAAM